VHDVAGRHTPSFTRPWAAPRNGQICIVEVRGEIPSAPVEAIEPSHLPLKCETVSHLRFDQPQRPARPLNAEKVFSPVLNLPGSAVGGADVVTWDVTRGPKGTCDG
jgi:hypothetical protein